jgi:hypothetical protein
LANTSKRPRQVRQMRCEKDRVLARAAADLEHLPPIRESYPQHAQDRPLVALTRIGKWQHAVLVFATVSV